jgi:hypothetical protein
LHREDDEHLGWRRKWASGRAVGTNGSCPVVRRRDDFIIDKHHLRYLNAVEKLNCFYCSYANGLVAYAREIAGRTEQYWCPIKHARSAKGPHGHDDRFVAYGDAQAYRDELVPLRIELARREEGS